MDGWLIAAGVVWSVVSVPAGVLIGRYLKRQDRCW